MKVVFLDRDGVINRYPGDTNYVTSLKNFRFLPFVKKALARLYKAGYQIFIISNQAGVSKGIFSQKALDEITAHIVNELEKIGVRFTGIYYCIHKNEDNCSCRKPKDGLIQMAVHEHGISRSALKKAFFIGDTIRDCMTARRAKIGSILVFSGKEKPENASTWEVKPDYCCRNLYEAVPVILREKPKIPR